MTETPDITLKIRVLDAQGNFRGGTVDVDFKHLTLSDHGTQRGLDASGEIAIAGLQRAPQGNYQITVTPTDVFKPESQFVNIPASGFAEMKVTIDRPHTPGPQPQPETPFEVKGTVRTSDGAPLAHVLVQAVHEGATSLVLGQGRTTDQGAYAIKYLTRPVSGSINLRVSVRDEQGRQLGASEVRPGAKPLELLDLTVPLVTHHGPTRQLKGRIVMDHGLSADKLSLRLYRYGFGGARTLLDETTTDDDGLYALTYEVNGKGISLEIRAVDGAGKETPLSTVMYNLGDEEKTEINLIAPGRLRPLAAEYQRLRDDLKPHVGEMKELGKLRENEERRDLTVLNRASGWDARLIALAANAANLNADPKVGLSQEVLYGLFRAGLPSDKLRLAQVSTDVIDQALTKLNEAGIVNLSPAQIVDAKQKFEAFAHETRLGIVAPGSHSTYSEMLDSAGISDTSRTKFAEVFLSHRGDSEQLWTKAAEAGIAASDIQRLQQQGKLAFLTLNNPRMVKRLQKDLAISDTVQLVDKDFYRADKWVAELRAVAGNDPQKLLELIPSAYAGEKVENSLNAYAEDMARKVRISFPTQVIGRMVQQDATDAFKLGPARATTATLLNNAAAKGFRLGQTPVEKFVSNNPEVLNGIAVNDRKSALQNAKTLQSVYQITPSNESLSTMLSLGLTSAYDVVATSREVFLDRYSARFPNDQADLVYRKARQVTSVTYNLFAIAKTLENTPPVHVLSSPTNVPGSVKDELVKHFPTMESLFGSMDFCECEHCRSVLSPAAYLVDLLQFVDVDSEPMDWTNFLAQWKSTHNNQDYAAKYVKPYDALIQRRPDIPYISLTCENTNTALPYIDLVNEVLEYYVANNRLEEKAAHDTGQSTTAELLAEPQNVIAEAYDKLQEARYPLNLPFDLWLETARRFSDYFETPLWQVLEALRPGDELFVAAQQYDRSAIFIESLGLSPGEYAIFTDPNPLARWHELYGYPTPEMATTEALDASNQRIDLNSAKTLSRRLAVSYKELVEILRTGFINPKLSELGILQKLGVTVPEVLSYRDHRGLLAQDPNTLSPENRTRLQEVQALEHRLDVVSDAFQSSGFDARAWLNTALANNTFNDILVLADPDAGCNFDLTTLRYAGSSAADAIAFLKINLFVRLWRKLGWTIEETDRALRVFVPRAAPYQTAHLAKQPLKTALIYLAHLKRLDEQLRLGKQSRLKLLTLWSSLATTGNKPLYAQLFLAAGILKSDDVFDDALGNYLSPAGVAAMAQSRKHQVSRENVLPADRIDPAAFAGHPKVNLSYDPLLNVQRLAYQGVLTDSDKAILSGLSASSSLQPLLDEVQAKARKFSLTKGHLPALQAALGLTAEEIDQIITDAGGDPATAALSLENVSLLYRYGLLGEALKLSIAELIALKQLSGVDPFKVLSPDPLRSLAEDSPFTQMLRFVEVAEQVKDSGLKIEDLEYILRHRFDETGKFRPNSEGELALMKTLSEGIRAIRAEHAVPDDPGAMSDDTLRQKLGLVLTAEVVQRFLAMMNGTVEFTASKTGVASADQLRPAGFEDEPSIRELSYDLTRQEQKLTFRGVLADDDAKTALTTRLPKPAPSGTHVFSTLLDQLLVDVQGQAAAFFKKYLQKPATNVQPATGFLDEPDFVLLFSSEPAGLNETQKQSRLRQQRTRLAQTFLPYLQQRLIRQFIIETMTAQTSADATLVDSLVTDTRLLSESVPSGVPRRSLLAAFAATSERGLSVTFFDGVNGTGATLATSTIANANTGSRDKQSNLPRPNTAMSALVAGYLEVPTAGAYRFYVKFEKKDAEAELRFEHLDHLSEPFLAGVAASVGAEIGDGPNKYVELRPSVPYRFSFAVKNLNGGDVQLLVQGEGLPKGSLSQLTLYPQQVIERADHSLILLRKVLLLVQGLNLGEREVRYMLTHAADFGGLDLSKLPTRTGDDTLLTSRELFGYFLRLAGYARLKRNLAGGTSDLIGIFETTAIEQVYKLIAKLLRREVSTVKATAKILFAAPRVSNELTMQRLWEALQVVERFGVNVASMAEWTHIVSASATPEQRFVVARDLKGAIKARFEPEAWQRVAQPIFDNLRQRQRDALVAHVMNQHNFARLEQLYEYFLIDPGMEPVVQTSRIRLAISSVQLFIQRCLLNLELMVHPSVINSKQWEWMKRYRVWEANRKIFLFPENWLEPEFRDDKTHLFSELEGALLQGDVSSDLVEDAFLNYLKKLDELAQLEIVGMHIEDDSDPALRTMHVIGRTYSDPHKYFYRRYAHQMWTSWEPISAQVEGRHLAPVVWRDRLYLFWVTFMTKPKPATSTTVAPTGFSIQPVEIEMEAQLHWSEYLKGEWLSPESGDLNPPASQKLKALSVDPRTVFIYVSKEAYENGEERGVFINLSWPFNQAFYLAGRNSVPQNAPLDVGPANPYSPKLVNAAGYSADSGPLDVTFVPTITTTSAGWVPSDAQSSNILRQGSGGFAVMQCDNNITLGSEEIATLVKPLFYQNQEHTLFIEPTVTETTLEDWGNYLEPPFVNPEWEWPVIIPDLPDWRIPVLGDPGDPFDRGPIDENSIIQTRVGRDWITNPGTTLLFEGSLVGPGGRTGVEVLSSEGISGALAAGGSLVNVHAGSDLVSGSAVVATVGNTLEKNGLALSGGALNIVGSGGLRPGMLQNLNSSLGSRSIS